MKIVFTPVEYPLTQLLQNVLLESFPIIVIGKQLRRHSSNVTERLLRAHLSGIFTKASKLIRGH